MNKADEDAKKRNVGNVVIQEIIEDIRAGKHSESLWEQIEKMLVDRSTHGRDVYEDATLEDIVYVHAKSLMRTDYQERIAEFYNDESNLPIDYQRPITKKVRVLTSWE